MTAVTFPVPPDMANRDSKKKSAKVINDRVELQAPEDWVREVDKAAEAVGLSRSAYIRLAVNKLMASDRREREES